jgi:hypothetical protein
MNLKKIIREELEDDWGWVKEINPSIVLEPNTLYYFEPVLSPNEIEGFAHRISNSNYIQQWLLRRMNSLVENNGKGIKYFVTSNDVNSSLGGWCVVTPIERAKQFYYGTDSVDARKEFNL